MFPTLSQRLSTGFLSRLDVIVELSTLGQYGIAEDGRPLPLERGRCESGLAPSRSRDAARARRVSAVAARSARA